ncbi:hypothetical protein DXB18_02395 [Clostridium sp. OM02-18AC]|uniref:hypothetical protein n=1 Tax=Clostridium sp. OM02-18AC TaxID=2292311 RepID=UPI000E514FF8|nr:hypothetical protein [Clostridium sp. OM02-18AC]RHV69047.1 hypothetical protein DXB18_02395 [Clostridium sp. OM02-18AC]
MKKSKKVRKIGQNEAFQEEKYNDKSPIHLPRQDFDKCLKSKINAANWGFLRQSKSNNHTVRIRFRRLKKKNVQVPG